MRNPKLFLMILAIVFLGTVFYFLRPGQGIKIAPQSPKPSSLPISQTDSPKIVSTKPDPLEEAIITADQIIEITFSIPLENVGEFKRKIEPVIDYEVKLTQDRKTVKIIPKKPYELGTGYTLFILPDSKFDGIGEWRKEQVYHFKTIRYRGI